MYKYGIRGIAFEWMEHYLSNRRQFVLFKYVKSEYANVTLVSIMCPLLLLLYVNDIANVSTLLVGEARAIWDVGHYGKSLFQQNSESSNCICVFHYSSVICRLRRASNIYIL